MPTLEVLGAPVTGLDKATSALSDALNGHPERADLALVTCGGEFDDDAGASADNTVVFATVVGADSRGSALVGAPEPLRRTRLAGYVPRAPR